jgi:hypothetical protein
MATKTCNAKVVKIAGVTGSPPMVEVSYGGSQFTVEAKSEWLLCVLGIALARREEIAITYEQGSPNTLLDATFPA